MELPVGQTVRQMLQPSWHAMQATTFLTPLATDRQRIFSFGAGDYRSVSGTSRPVRFKDAVSPTSIGKAAALSAAVNSPGPVTADQ